LVGGITECIYKSLEKIFLILSEKINFMIVEKKNYCSDDPVWEPWHETAYGVQGGADDSSSSSASEDETEQPITLPSTCVCDHCRSVQYKIIAQFFLHK
jgi:hypothetical protein